MPEPILEARELCKSFPRRGGMLRAQQGAILAVDRVTCALGQGETLGLVGESGSGKTTLAKLLIGLLVPTGGEVVIRGVPFDRLRGRERLAARRAVQFVFQDPMNSLNPRMTVEETLSEPLAIHRLAGGRAARRARIRELLETVQLPDSFRHRLPRQLSGGERQRVGIARALATQPAALICDEPIASLDVSVGARIIELLRRLHQEQGTALLFVSHDLRAVAALCRRIAVMQQGQLVEVGATDRIITRPQHAYTQLLLRSAALDLDAS